MQTNAKAKAKANANAKTSDATRIPTTKKIDDKRRDGNSNDG